MNRIVILLCMCAVISNTACKSKAAIKEEVIKYTVTSPLVVDTSYDKEFVSQIRSVRNIEIRALEKGYLQKIYVDEGGHVSAGQLLFRIMPTMYEAEVLKATAETKQASIELQNTKLLADKNIVSKNELAMAQAKLDAANAGLKLARIHLNFTEIRAPFAGTIDRIPLKLGSLVDEGQLLTSLSDNSQMFVYFNVSEPEYLDYQTNQKNRGSTKVKLLLANNQLLQYQGQVETIESEFNSETGNIAFRSRFPNPDRLLKNGETGKVLMTVPLHNALVIPQKATYEIQDKKFVYVVDKNGVVSSRNITVTGQMPDLYIVSTGLNERDKILLEGVQNVKEDNKITAAYITPRNAVDQLRLKAE